jgi:hypothetical protein
MGLVVKRLGVIMVKNIKGLYGLKVEDISARVLEL